eukprot:TRINITY_DN5519_c0_g1_i1.p1 TRINITY_DN5519_c0_g1~~TRINITY_DN5519_c0_g1_i1.p1  ORF type:complete len:356 (-),score=129.64 TRINITY_DN5519_c0_g1_i1:366-1433(-)
MIENTSVNKRNKMMKYSFTKARRLDVVVNNKDHKAVQTLKTDKIWAFVGSTLCPDKAFPLVYRAKELIKNKDKNVYLESSSKKNNVVIKIWPVEEFFYPSVDSVDQPLREVTILKFLKAMKIKHTVRLEDILFDEKYIMVVMNDCGKPLADVAGTLSEDEVAKLFSTICSTVKTLHECGIEHGDLCLSNIAVDDKLNPSLIDFGCAKFTFGSSSSKKSVKTPVSSSPSYSELVGKAQFAAPEILDAQANIDIHSSQLWSLGCVLYGLLFGFLPFGSASSSCPIYEFYEEFGFKKLANAQMDECGIEVSNAAIDLIDHLLVVDPKDRMCLGNVLSHDLVAKVSAPKIELPVVALAG